MAQDRSGAETWSHHQTLETCPQSIQRVFDHCWYSASSHPHTHLSLRATQTLPLAARTPRRRSLVRIAWEIRRAFVPPSVSEGSPATAGIIWWGNKARCSSEYGAEHVVGQSLPSAMQKVGASFSADLGKQYLKSWFGTQVLYGTREGFENSKRRILHLGTA